MITQREPIATPARPKNLRTALVLLSIALVFFAGIILNHVLFG